MEKALIDALLRVVQQPAPVRLRPGKTLAAFARDYNLGRARGAQLEFSAADQQQIRGLLQARAGIDADRVTPQSWLGLSRAESLGLGADEKFSRAPVRRQRVSNSDRPIAQTAATAFDGTAKKPGILESRKNIDR